MISELNIRFIKIIKLNIKYLNVAACSNSIVRSVHSYGLHSCKYVKASNKLLSLEK